MDGSGHDTSIARVRVCGVATLNRMANIRVRGYNRSERVSPKAYKGPLVDQQSYPTPRKILKCQEVKIEKEANECIADELQPYRNVIDEDMMECIDENESDDRAM